MLRTPALIVSFIGVFASTVVASSAPTFCKCICFSNYTIIPLGPQHDADNPNNPPSSPSTDDDNNEPSSSSVGDDDELGLVRPARKQTQPPVDNFPQDDLDLMHQLNEELEHSRGSLKKEESPRSKNKRVDSPLLNDFFQEDIDLMHRLNQELQHSYGWSHGSQEKKQQSPGEKKRCLEPLPSKKYRRDDGLFSPFDLLPRFPDVSSFALISQKRSSSSSCNECNRAFCMSYNLPICKDAEEKDVQTMCFQRDSRKDQIIVWVFILGTGGLLSWAGIRRLLALREGRDRRGNGTEGRFQHDTPRGIYRPIEENRAHRESGSSLFRG